MGDYISAARTSVPDTAGSAEDVGGGSFVNGHTAESRSCVGAFDATDIVAATTSRNFAGPTGRLLAPFAVGHDRDSTPNLHHRGSAALSRRKALHAITTVVTAVAGSAYHTADGANGSDRVASKAASAHVVVRNSTAAFTGKVGARTVTIGDATTKADLVILCQATLAIATNITAATVADSFTPFIRDATADIGGGPDVRSFIAASGQNGAVAATKAVAGEAMRALEGRSLGP